MCTSCPETTIPSILLNDGGCAPAPLPYFSCPLSNCIYCASETYCSLCAIGYTLQNGNCSKIACTANSNCQLCVGTQKFCWLCLPGYSQASLLDPQCLKIPSNYSCEVEGCAFCSGPNACQTCIETYALTDNNTCVPAQCLPNCLVCLYNQTCMVCNPGFEFDSAGQCVYVSTQQAAPNCSSIPNCKVCDYGYGEFSGLYCEFCMPGFEPNNNGQSCVLSQCLVPNCQLCLPSNPHTCVVCTQGYTQNEYLECDQYTPALDTSLCGVKNCLTCSSNNYCTACVPGWAPVEGLCSNNHICSIENCLLCLNNNTCITCSNGYCLSNASANNTCTPCSDDSGSSSGYSLGLVLGLSIPLAILGTFLS